MKKLALAVVAASILLGCLSSAPDPKLAELQSQANSLQAKCAAADAAKGALQSSLDKANAAKAACDTELADARARVFSQNQSDSLAAAQAALESVSSNASVAKATAGYKDLSSFGCFYYLGGGGFYTGSNVTIPTRCAVAFDDYIRSSYAAVAAAGADNAKVQSALDALKSARGG